MNADRIRIHPRESAAHLSFSWKTATRSWQTTLKTWEGINEIRKILSRLAGSLDRFWLYRCGISQPLDGIGKSLDRTLSTLEVVCESLNGCAQVPHRNWWILEMIQRILEVVSQISKVIRGFRTSNSVRTVNLDSRALPANLGTWRSREWTMSASSSTTSQRPLLSSPPELIGEVVQYEDKYRLCYMRGPAGIIVALSEELF